MSSDERRAERIGLTELLRALRRAQSMIADRVVETVESGKSSQRYYSQRYKSIERIYQSIRALWSSYIDDETRQQYSRYSNSIQRQLEAAGKSMRGEPRAQVLNQMIQDSIARMNLATENGLNNVLTLFRDTQQAVIADIEITRRLAEGVIVDMSPTNLRKVLQSELYKALKGGKVLMINGRKYRVDYYAEMVARTRTREAQTAATIDMIRAFGEDLVRISDHNTTTPICKPHEGRIYSITGLGGYPLLVETPPYHPNCQHVVTPYV
jgi:hypothetical protein